MNLYLVVSEEIYHVEWEDVSVSAGHREDYRIAELVVARSHAQAKYLAWRADKDGDTWPSVEDMPKFAVRLKRQDVEGPARIATGEWRTKIQAGIVMDKYPIWAEDLWYIGSAPHIGIGREE